MNYPTFQINHIDNQLTQQQIDLIKDHGIVSISAYGLACLAELQTVAWLTQQGFNPVWNAGRYDRDITVGRTGIDVKHTCTHYYPFPEGTVSVKASSLRNQFTSIMVFVWLKKDEDLPKVQTSVDTAYLVGWLWPDEVKQCEMIQTGQQWKTGQYMKYDSYRVQVRDMHPMNQLETYLA